MKVFHDENMDAVVDTAEMLVLNEGVDVDDLEELEGFYRELGDIVADVEELVAKKLKEEELPEAESYAASTDQLGERFRQDIHNNLIADGIHAIIRHNFEHTVITAAAVAEFLAHDPKVEKTTLATGGMRGIFKEIREILLEHGFSSGKFSTLLKEVDVTDERVKKYANKRVLQNCRRKVRTMANKIAEEAGKNL